MKINERQKNIVILTASVLIFLLGVTAPIFYYSIQAEQVKSLEKEEENKEKEEKRIEENPFDGVEIKAKSAFVWDINNQKELYSKNPDQTVPLASITKVLTALTALDILPGDTVVNIERDFIMAEGNSGLFINEKWSLEDLIDFSLVSSINDGSRALASIAGAFILGENDNYEVNRKEFVSKMNQKAREIGMKNSSFYNESGLDENDQQSGAYSTAKETAILFEYALKNRPEIFKSTTRSQTLFQSLTGINHLAFNTNEQIDLIPSVLASKTGFTDLAGGNLVVAFDPGIGRPIIISVLGSTHQGRVEDVLILAQKTLDYLRVEDFLKNSKEGREEGIYQD